MLVDLGRLQDNIERMALIARRSDVDLRPHAKAHKLPEIAGMQLAAGATGLTVAKLGEAEVFIDHGFSDVFVAYPLWGQSKWGRLCELAERARVSVSLDSHEAVAGLADVAVSRGLSIPVRIEIDTGFGRCGLLEPDQVLDLARRVAGTPGVAFNGLMSFAGQSYEQRTRSALQAVADHDAKLLLRAARLLREHGIDVPAVSAGGTPTAGMVAGIAGVTEIRPGAYALSDRDQVALGWSTEDQCALTVLSTVVSRPSNTRAVIDAGTKTLSSDRSYHRDGWGTVLGYPELSIRNLTEEHGIVEVQQGFDLALGTRLRVIPNHGCGTINMHDSVVAVQGDEVIDTWRVAARARVQ